MGGEHKITVPEIPYWIEYWVVTKDNVAFEALPTPRKLIVTYPVSDTLDILTGSTKCLFSIHRKYNKTVANRVSSNHFRSSLIISPSTMCQAETGDLGTPVQIKIACRKKLIANQIMGIRLSFRFSITCHFRPPPPKLKFPMKYNFTCFCMGKGICPSH